MMPQPNPSEPAAVGAAVLVGGAATRMGGADKPLLDLCGRPLLEWILEVLRPRFREVLLVAREPGAYRAWCPPCGSLRLALDSLPSRSSLTGLHTALSHATGTHVFITAGDTPLLRPELVDALLRHLRPEDDVVLPLKPDGYFEPLCAIYSRRCLPPVQAQAARGEHKLIAFFDQVRVHPLPPETLLRADPLLDSFRNANTPDELRSLRHTARLRAASTGGHQ